jgi:hypothetical protein
VKVSNPHQKVGVIGSLVQVISANLGNTAMGISRTHDAE